MRDTGRPREDELEVMLSDLAFCARNALRKLPAGPLRDELKRACNRVAAFYTMEKAAVELAANAPNPSDERPEPPIEAYTDADDEPASQQRLPYRDD